MQLQAGGIRGNGALRADQLQIGGDSLLKSGDYGEVASPHLLVARGGMHQFFF